MIRATRQRGPLAEQAPTVARVEGTLGGRCACGQHVGSAGSGSGCQAPTIKARALPNSSRPLALPSRAISRPSDPDEISAERTADRLLRESPRPGQAQTAVASSPPAGTSTQLPPHASRAIGTAGVPLSAADRAYFEPRIGMSLGHLRVHSGSAAAESAAAFSAQAYTTGADIVLGRSDDRRLLAHELVHAVTNASSGWLNCGVARQGMSVDLTKLDDQALRWDAIKASAWFENHLPTDPDYEARVTTSRYLFEETSRRLGAPATAADTNEFEDRLRATSPRTTFELKLKSGNPERYSPIRKDGEIIGYVRRSGGYTEARDIDGRIVWSDEIGLEKPFLDPIDFIPFELVGTLIAKTATFAVRTTGRVLVKTAGRVAGKEATTGIAKGAAVEATAALEKGAAKRLTAEGASSAEGALAKESGSKARAAAGGGGPATPAGAPTPKKWFSKPSIKADPLRPAGTGATNKFGDVVYSSAGSATDVALVRAHELVHSVLSPKFVVMRNLRADISMWFYKNSQVMRYLEEMLAEGYAQLAVKGVKALPKAFRFPMNGYSITVSGLIVEGAAGTITVGGITYGVYALLDGDDQDKPKNPPSGTP